MAVYNTGSSTVYDTKTFKDQLRLFIVSSKCLKDFFKWQDIETAEISTIGQSIV